MYTAKNKNMDLYENNLIKQFYYLMKSASRG